MELISLVNFITGLGLFLLGINIFLAVLNSAKGDRGFLSLCAFSLSVPFAVYWVVVSILFLQGVDLNTLDQLRANIFVVVLLTVQLFGLSIFAGGGVEALASLVDKGKAAEKKEGQAVEPQVDTS